MNSFFCPAVLLTVWLNSNCYVLALSERFLPADKSVFSFWHSSLFLYFWTCTIMASSCRSKVALHLFSYVGAVIQKLPQHLSSPQRGVHRAAAFSERLAVREREAGSTRGTEIEEGGEKSRRRNQCQARSSFSPCTWRREEGGVGGAGWWWIGGRMRSGGTGGLLRSIKNQ